MAHTSTPRYARVNLHAVAGQLPASATTPTIDRVLIDKLAGSARVIRVYRPTVPYCNTVSDEFLYVLSGRGTFWAESESNKVEFGAGDLLCFDRDVVHAMSDVLAGPLVFLAVDTPGRGAAAGPDAEPGQPAE